MSERALPLRFALYGALPFMAAASHSWPLAAVLGGLVGFMGLRLEARLRSWFDPQISFFATITLLSSVSVTGPPGSPDLVGVGFFLAGSVCFVRFSNEATPRPAFLALAASLALLPSILDLAGASWWRLSLDNSLVALFGASGILYGAPLLWTALLGLPFLAREQTGSARLALAALVPGLAATLLATDRTQASRNALAWLPFLLPGMAWSFRGLRGWAARRPARVVAAAGAAMVLWNVLFMEQYRRHELPNDDTVSFATVTSQSASLVAGITGAPFAWPANWIFAWRYHVGPEQWDGIAGRRLFAAEDARAATIEFGDEPSPLTSDDSLLAEGFGPGHLCEQGRCRDLYDEGRILLPIENPGRGKFVLRLRARGEGVLRMSLNGAAISVFDLPESLSDLVLEAPAGAAVPGVNVLSLVIEGGGKATLDRLILERDLATGSAR